MVIPTISPSAPSHVAALITIVGSAGWTRDWKTGATSSPT